MAYLHENKEEFRNAVNLASERFHILPVVAEKDYYVTMILRGLTERLEFVVFKGACLSATGSLNAFLRISTLQSIRNCPRVR